MAINQRMLSDIGARKDTPVTISDDIEQITKYSLSMPDCEQKMEAEETRTNRSFWYAQGFIWGKTDIL